MIASAMRGQFADELAELHEGSVSLFVTLPVFRSLVISQHCADVLAKSEAMIGEHLAYLDGILGEILVRRDRMDGELTRSLFRAISRVRLLTACAERDVEIIRVIEQAQLFLMGSCSFALRSARQAKGSRTEQVLEESLHRIGSLAGALTTAESHITREMAQVRCAEAV